MFTAWRSLLTFQANLFNIGAQGQFYIGAVTAVWLSLLLQDSCLGRWSWSSCWLATILTGGAVGRIHRLAQGQVQRQRVSRQHVSTYVARSTS